MRSSRRTRQGANLSLFPFLAVLICTMGVLIVLLVIVVKHADHAAQQVRLEKVDTVETKPEPVPEPSQPEPVDLQPKLDALKLAGQKSELQIELLTDVREQVKADLEEKQQLRSNVQANINDLRGQADALNKRLTRIEQLEQAEIVQSAEAARSNVAELQREVESAKQHLAEASTISIKPSYAIIPFRGSGETDRRPIFVECTASAIILQPYGIKLLPKDFQEPVLAGNPLDAALLTIRDYLHSHSTGQTVGQPYPLLIVRPDGALGYAEARCAMKSWVDQFGYELIPADMQLSYPPPEPQLISKIEQTIKAARIRMDAIRQAANRRIDLSTIANNQYGNQLRSPQVRYLPGSGGQSENASAPITYPSQQPANPFRQHQASQPVAGTAPEASSTDSHVGASPERRLDQFSTAKFAGDVASPASVASVKQQGALPGGDSSTEFTDSSSQSDRGTAARFAASRNGENRQQDAPTFQSSMSAHPGSSTGSPASLAQTKGKDWALPSKQQKGTAYRRRIYLDCSSHQLFIKSAATESSRNASVNLTRETVYHIDELIDQVWRQVDSWGIAGLNSYWKPQLVIRVKQGGSSRAAEIKTLLEDSGLDILLMNP